MVFLLGVGWLVVVGILLYALFEGMCQGAMGVRGGLGRTCVYGVCCWWECPVSVF